MRMLRPLVAFILSMASVPALASGGGPAKAGPVGIPFACSDGRVLRVFYSNVGQPRGFAELVFADAEPIELEPAHSLLGLRYQTHGEGGGPVKIWWTDGISGKLIDATAAWPAKAQETVTLQCERIGWTAGSATDAAYEAAKAPVKK